MYANSLFLILPTPLCAGRGCVVIKAFILQSVDEASIPLLIHPKDFKKLFTDLIPGA